MHRRQLARSQSRSVALLFALVPCALSLAFASAGDAEDEAASSVAAEIRAVLMEGNRYVRENLSDPPGLNSRHGTLEFWSSGGLLHRVPADPPPTRYESFSIVAKHIEVIELPGGEAAVALYYSDGAMHPEGRAPVGNYRTRVLQVFVKEDGEWKARAGHWSPLVGGGGTSLTGPEE